MRSPSRTSPRRALLNTPINLLQTQSLELIDTEVRKDRTASAKTAKYVEDLRAQVGVVHADEVWVDNSNDGVPQPVGCSTEADAAGSNRQGKDLANDDPSCWSPGGGKERDEDAEKSDFSGGAGCGLVFVCDADGGSDELADHHPDGAPDEERSPTEFLDCVEGDGRDDAVDEVADDLGDEGVLDGFEIAEEDGAVVEDEVYAGPLLEHLEGGAGV